MKDKKKACGILGKLPQALYIDSIVCTTSKVII